MLYQGYQTHADLMAPWQIGADIAACALDAPSLGRLRDFYGVRSVKAALDVFTGLRLNHRRPSFGIERVAFGNGDVVVHEDAVFSTPFGTLRRFRKDRAASRPAVLVIAPLSGHFATLLRGTVKVLVPDHDVYVTDWHNARDVPVEAGRFGFDDYVDHVITFLEKIERPAHLLAVCQPCVHALVAVSVMAARGHPYTPRSMTLMAGPIDTRVSPTEVDRLATAHSIDWFEDNLISTVPWRHAGWGRRVYPGFVQLTAFMSMNPERHAKAQMDLFTNLAAGNLEKAAATRRFYDEYFSVLDMTAEFYLETIKSVFQDHDLPRGALRHRGETVDPAKIRRTALFTVEGERDDICAVGQTLAAQDLCTGIKPSRKKHHLQPGAGHYGVFNGRKWETQIYPLFKTMVLANE